MAVDRLNTKTMMQRRHYNTQGGIYCVLWSHNSEEDIDHLFFTCPAAYKKWNILNINWNGNLPIHQRVKEAKRNSVVHFFMEIFMIGAWCI